MDEKELKELKKEHQKKDKVVMEIYERIEALESLLLNDKYPPKKGEYKTIGEWKAHLETWILNRNETRRIIKCLCEESHKVCEEMGKIFVPVKNHFIPEVQDENPNKSNIDVGYLAGKKAKKFLEK